MTDVAKLFDADMDHVMEKAAAVSEDLKSERKRALAMERELSRRVAESLLQEVQSVKGITVLAGKVPFARAEVLREMGDLLRDRLKSAVIVLGTVQDERPLFLSIVTPDLVQKGYHAGNIIREVAKVAGGGGGGKPNLAQAGGKDKDKLDEALRRVNDLL
jgi:alanyl-tRNA synthetase